MSRAALRVGLLGCGRMGVKRTAALAPSDSLVACFDVDAERTRSLAREHGATASESVEGVLSLSPDVVIVAVTHDELAPLAEMALEAGANVLLEKPAGLGTDQIERLIELEARSGRRVKVGFNHRFHPGIRRLAAEVHSGRHGDLLHVRGRYGHGGRPGYETEWRALPERSGGGELTDQGMHLLDLTHWLAGELPLHSALLRTHFWDMPVEDNAALILGDADVREGPWAMLHVTWTEWKNMFSLEVYCRSAKLQVDGLVASYGPQRLRIYSMRPELGPPDLEQVDYPDEDPSWAAEWEHFAEAIDAADGRPLLGDLRDARYAWEQVEAAYAMGPYASMREAVAR
jgi:predicted dehydrogenase